MKEEPNLDYQTYIDACGKDGAKIERLIRDLYHRQPQRRVFLDGGAHGGYHSFYAAKYFSERVIGVEASPEIFINLIKTMVGMPQGGCEILPVNAALGSRAKQGDTTQFFYSPSHPGRSTVNTKMWEEWGKGSVEYAAPILAPIIELDDLTRLYAGGKTVDFIKLDLEGNEINALRGGARTLREHRPSAVIEFGLKPGNEHLFGDTLAGFRQLLSDWGYRAYSPWAEDVTDSLVQGYAFWYLFLLPEGDQLQAQVALLADSFRKSIEE